MDTETKYTLGSTLRLKCEDGSEDVLLVRQLKVADYPKTAAAIEAGDEIQAIANSCNRPRSWAERLEPDSYEEAARAFYGVNQRFFSYVGRVRLARESLQNSGSVSQSTSAS